MQQRDFSREMIVSRHPYGVKLIKPQRSNADDGHLLRLGDLLANPYNVFFYDLENVIKEINDPCWSNCGFQSRNDAIGNSVWTVCEEEDQIETIIKNNQQVIRARNMLTVDEHMNLANDIYSHTVSFKFPWLDANNELIGIFGCAVHVNHENLRNVSGQLAMIVEKFCATRADVQGAVSTQLINGNFFSAREMEVIQLIMRGKTVKETALQLGLSQRTVESYFSNIKLKLNVTTKSEFFEKMIAENV